MRSFLDKVLYLLVYSCVVRSKLCYVIEGVDLVDGIVMPI